MTQFYAVENGIQSNATAAVAGQLLRATMLEGQLAAAQRQVSQLTDEAKEADRLANAVRQLADEMQGRNMVTSSDLLMTLDRILTPEHQGKLVGVNDDCKCEGCNPQARICKRKAG